MLNIQYDDVTQMKTDTAQTIPTNVVPDKLLRIFISNYCNFRCTFCGWPPDGKKDSAPTMSPTDLGLITRAMVATDCHNFQISGGEPLILKRDYLVEVISTISSVDGVNQFWAVTNGAMLVDRGLCNELRQAGLKRVNVSVAAETNEKYLAYNRSGFNLDDVFRAMQNAVESGIEVHIHACLNTDGVSSFDQLEALFKRAEQIGVRNAFYFQLYKTEAIEDQFNRMYVDPQRVTEGFLISGRWELGYSEKGRPFLTNGQMKINVPRRMVYIVTDNCRRNDCGEYCQGIYSGQLTSSADGLMLSACQRVFPDRRNVFPVDKDMLATKNVAGLTESFRIMWQYAYGR
jgi:molybdenum cofactor biosynthesis enzyme MoaA